MTGAEVIRMRMRHHMRGQIPSPQLPDNPSRRRWRPRIHQDVIHEIRVHEMRRPTQQLINPRRKLPHHRILTTHRS
jgi:hypothetical protein